MTSPGARTAGPRQPEGPDVLVVFTRAPVRGRTKTRLIPVLGATGAAALHRQLVDRTLDTARATRQAWPCVLEVRLDGRAPEASRDWLGRDLDIVRQGEGSLGERMARVFDDHFRAGATRVVLVGTDIPDLTPAILERAFRALAADDVALGPARDGGYYLVGLRRPIPELFDGIAWGGCEVFSDTLARAASAGVSVAHLEVLSDVDRPEDLARIEPSRLPVWIDTDPSVGLPDRDVDDGLALVQAFHSPELVVRGVSVVFGNVSLAEAMPIAKTIVRRFGPRGLVVHRGAAAATDLGVETPATLALADALRREPLTILALGPVTTIATVLTLHPALAARVNAVVAVAGRRPGQRFTTGSTNPRSHRDFNFEQDPEAFSSLLQSHVPLVLAPFEVSSQVWLTEQDLARLDRGGPAGRWLAGPARGWLHLWRDVFGVDGFNPFDALAVAAVATPAWLHGTELPVRIHVGPDDVTEARLQGTHPPEKPYLEVSEAFVGVERRVRYCHDVDARFKDDLIRRIASGAAASALKR